MHRFQQLVVDNIKNMNTKEFDYIFHHEKLNLPEKSAWDRTVYDPILLLYKSKKEWPSWADKAFEIWFLPKRTVLALIDFFRRLRRWIPVLWRDRDWDDTYIFEIIKTKLISQRQYLVKNFRHTNVPYVNRDITICLNLIERFQNSYYEVEYFDYYQAEHYFEELSGTHVDGQKLYELKHNTTWDNLTEYIEKYPNTKSDVIRKHKMDHGEDLSDYAENEESRQRLALYMSTHRHEKCKNLIFKILSYKIEGWWD